MSKENLFLADAKTKAQLNWAANEGLCFRNIDSTIPCLPKFHASCHLLWLNSPVHVGPGRKHERQVNS